LNTEKLAFEHRLYQEVVSLPFNSESQVAISKNSFSCLLNIVTCDRGVGMRTPFIRKKDCDTVPTPKS
ncbi:hypothetical protein, partial [Enterococcus faecium]